MKLETLNIKPKTSWLPVSALVAVFVVLYWPAINEFIYDWWHDDNYSHGFLIPVISAYLLWQRREDIRLARKESNLIGLVVLLTGLALNILGTAAAEWYTVRFSLILVLLGLVLYLWGRHVLRHVWFPIVFIVFAIPLPYTLFRTLTFPMQLFSTRVTHTVITTVGIPALRQGNLLYLPGYSLEVIEACSGLRSMIVLSALAAVFAYMSPGGVFRKLFMFGLSVPIAIGANIIRLLVTSFGALLISPAFAEGFLHDFSGILVFMLGLTCFFVVNWLLGKAKVIVLSKTLQA